MALQTSLAPPAVTIAQALRDYARERGWVDGSYRIDMVASSDWRRIGVTITADAFDGQDEYDRYDDLRDYLETKLSDAPELLETVGLVLRGPSEAVEAGGPPLNQDDVWIDLSSLADANL